MENELGVELDWKLTVGDLIIFFRSRGGKRSKDLLMIFFFLIGDPSMNPEKRLRTFFCSTVSAKDSSAHYEIGTRET